MKLGFKIFAFVFSLVGGLVLAGGGMYVAWQHNPQQEIYSEVGIDWGYWLSIGASWLFVGFVIFYLISIPVYKFIYHVIERKQEYENDL